MTASGARQMFYAAAALTGLVLTWYFNLRYSSSAGYVADWFANDASSSVAVDLIVVAVVASVFMLTESCRVGIGLPVTLVFVLAGFLVAMACAFPLFLLLRERRVTSQPPARQPLDPEPPDPAAPNGGEPRVLSHIVPSARRWCHRWGRTLRWQAGTPR